LAAQELRLRDRAALLLQREVGRLLAPLWIPVVVAGMRFGMGWRIEGKREARERSSSMPSHQLPGLVKPTEVNWTDWSPRKRSCDVSRSLNVTFRMSKSTEAPGPSSLSRESVVRPGPNTGSQRRVVVSVSRWTEAPSKVVRLAVTTASPLEIASRSPSSVLSSRVSTAFPATWSSPAPSAPSSWIQLSRTRSWPAPSTEITNRALLRIVAFSRMRVPPRTLMKCLSQRSSPWTNVTEASRMVTEPVMSQLFVVWMSEVTGG